MSYVATTGGIGGEEVRDLMVAAVEHRFGRIDRLPDTIEWLSDNGSGYIAHETRSFLFGWAPHHVIPTRKGSSARISREPPPAARRNAPGYACAPSRCAG